MDVKNTSKSLYKAPTISGSINIDSPFPFNFSLPFSEGNMQVNYKINENPEVRLSFQYISPSDIDNIRKRFEEGSIHSIFGIQYIVVNYSETSDITTFTGLGTLSIFTVDVTFNSYAWLKASTNVELTYPTTSYISAKQIADKANVGYSGFPFNIYVTQDNINQTFEFTLLNEIKDRLKEFQHIMEVNSQGITTRGLITIPMVKGQISPFQLSCSIPTQYNKAKITWNNNTIDPFKNDPSYLSQDPNIEYIQEGDLDIETAPINFFHDTEGKFIDVVSIANPENPANSGVPLKIQDSWYNAGRALHLVFDNNGITKQVKITKKVNGSIEWVETYRYGFVFTAYNLARYGGTPQQYWRLIDYTRTNYIYKEANQLYNKVVYKDKSGVYRQAVISPELLLLLSKSKVKYLVRTETYGQKYIRFQQESFNPTSYDIEKDTGCPASIFYGKRVYYSNEFSSTFGQDAILFFTRMFNLYAFRVIETFGATDYHLVSSESIYKDAKKSLNLSTEKVAFSSLPINLQNVTQPDSNGEVELARPDPNAYHEYIVLSETSQDISLAWIEHPLSIPYNNTATKIETDTPNSPLNSAPTQYNPNLQPYVVGQNTYSSTERKVIPNFNTTGSYAKAYQQNNSYKFINYPQPTYNTDSDKLNDIDLYVEYRKNKTLDGINFSYQTELVEFSEVEGRPPSAEVLRENSFIQDPKSTDPFYKKDKEYYYTSILNSNFPVDVYNTTINMLEIPQTDLARTKLACDFLNRMENAINTKEMSVDVGFYRPEYSVGSITTLPYYNGLWLIKQVTHTFKFNGKFLSAEPTKLVMGQWFSIVSDISNSNFSNTRPSNLPPEEDDYRILGTQNPLEFNPPSTFPSIIGERGNAQPLVQLTF